MTGGRWIEPQAIAHPSTVACGQSHMTCYRRSFVAGGRYFFTVNLTDRRRGLLFANIGLLRAVFRRVRQQHPFAIDAIVVLPDHLHTCGHCRREIAISPPAGV